MNTQNSAWPRRGTLTVCSTTGFWVAPDGVIHGHRPTTIEYGMFTKLFERVRVLGTRFPERPHFPIIELPPGVEVEFTPAFGTPTMWDKWKILPNLLRSMALLAREVRAADFVQLRTPDNLAILALPFVAMFRKRYVWAKYAGAWAGWPRESIAYKVARWILRNDLLGIPVTINPVDVVPNHCHAFKNPSYFRKFVEAGNQATQGKQIDSSDVRLICIGELSEGKGFRYAIELVERLRSAGIGASLDIFGGGPCRADLEEQAESAGLQDHVRLRGVVPLQEIAPFLGQAHFIVCSSIGSEGWPKVLSEGMSHRCVPLSFRRGAIPYFLNEAGVGAVVDAADVEALTEVAMTYILDPEHWRAHADQGQRFSKGFCYEAYIAHLQEVLLEAWKLTD